MCLCAVVLLKRRLRYSVCFFIMVHSTRYVVEGILSSRVSFPKSSPIALGRLTAISNCLTLIKVTFGSSRVVCFGAFLLLAFLKANAACSRQALEQRATEQQQLKAKEANSQDKALLARNLR